MVATFTRVVTAVSSDRIVVKILNRTNRNNFSFKPAHNDSDAGTNFSHLYPQTTAVALVWLLYVLATEPEVQEKLREEVRAHLPERDSPVSDHVLHDCTYLNAVVKETLRSVVARVFSGSWVLPHPCHGPSDAVIHGQVPEEP